MAAPGGGLQKAVEAQTDPITKAMSPKPRPNKKANVALEMLMQSSTYILARLDLHLLMRTAWRFLVGLEAFSAGLARGGPAGVRFMQHVE